MARRLLSYLIWVLVPAALAFGVARELEERVGGEQLQESGTRIGRLGQVLFMEEMAHQAGALARSAPVLPDPDQASPIIRAAQRGDTVAALGTSSGELVLSVALEEVAEGQPEPRIRALTQPFKPLILSRIHGSVGYSGALYFRGHRVEADPEGFGPDSLSRQDLQHPISGPTPFFTQAGAGVLLPLSETASSTPPLHLLVTPSLPSAPDLPWGTSRIVFFAGAALGLLTLMRRNGGKEGWARTSLLVAYGAPMSVMWIGLVTGCFWIELRDTGFRQGEMVRLLAVLQEGEENLPPETLAQAIDFEVTRLSGDTVVSTIKEESLLRRTVGLPFPTSGLPSTGVEETDPVPIAFASALGTRADRIILTGPKNRGDLQRRRLVLAGLGGVASLLGLVFLFGGRTKEGGAAG